MRRVVPEAEADQGVALVVVMPAVPRVDRRRYVTKRDLVKYGYTDECQACTQSASGMHNAKVPHDDRCRDRIASSWQSTMTRDKLSECLGQMKSRVWKPEQRWMLANLRFVWLDRWKNSQFPHFEWVDHQAQEPNLE